MKSHLLIASGLWVGAIFVMRGLDVLAASGSALQTLYILGGFAIAALLIRAGLKERRAAAEQEGTDTDA